MSLGPAAGASATGSGPYVSHVNVTATASTDPVACIYSATATIVTSGPATVQYRIRRDDAGPTPATTVSFPTAGSKTITIPTSSKHGAGTAWVQVEVESPNAVSQRATAELPRQCTPHGTATAEIWDEVQNFPGYCPPEGLPFTMQLKFTASEPDNIWSYKVVRLDTGQTLYTNTEYWKDPVLWNAFQFSLTDLTTKTYYFQIQMTAPRQLNSVPAKIVITCS